MSTLSSHVLDTAAGRPAGELLAILSVQTETGWKNSRVATNEDGRIGWQHPDESGWSTAYLLRFDTAAYFQRTNVGEELIPMSTSCLQSLPAMNIIMSRS